jgi:DNA-binding transcriptional LysR family regulator
MVMMENPIINFKTLDLNLLRVFDVIMSEQSLTKAASRLSLTQPAVSNALRRLREHLNDELLVREGPRLRATPQAKWLWPQIREALNQLEKAITPDPFDPLQSNMPFILAMADATAAELIPALSKIFENEAPHASLRVIPLTTRDPRKLLTELSAHIAVGHFPGVLADLTAKAQSDELVMFDHFRLFEGEYVCVMRRNHPLSKAVLDLEAFCQARHMLVSFSGRPFGFVDEALAALGRQRKVAVTVNQFATAGRVVLNSDLLTVLPKHFVRVAGLAEQLCIKPIPLKLQPVHVDLLWYTQFISTQAHEWLRSVLVRAAKEVLDVN